VKNDQSKATAHDDFSKHVGSLANGKKDTSHNDHGTTSNHSSSPTHNPTVGRNPSSGHNPVAPSRSPASKGKGK
jgi:hypothetical protein